MPCGKCNFCLSARRADWCFRLEQELRVSVAADFLTLTYSDENLPQCDSDGVWIPEGNLVKRDLQLFMKRLRKRQKEMFADRRYRIQQVWGHRFPCFDHFDNLRYYSVGEYGSVTRRPHYHSILFNMSRELLSELPGIWKLGHVYRGAVTGASINYVAKFHINKVGEFEGRQRPFALISNRSGGLGKNYLASESWHRRDMANYVMSAGRIGRLPKYFKDRFFSPDEKDGLRREMEHSGFERSMVEVEKLEKLYGARWSAVMNYDTWFRHNSIVHKSKL